MRPAKAPLLLLALGLFALPAGCGGGSTSSTASTAATAQVSAAKPKPRPEQSQKSGGKPQGAKPKPRPEQRQSGGKSQAAKSQKAGDAVLTDPEPLPNQGTAAVAPGVPTVKGGDDSIQTYGVEAQSAERVKAARLVKAYLGAQAAGHWASACADLSAVILKKLELATRGAPRIHASGCPGALAALISKTPPAIRRRAAQIRVLSLRVEGARAFIIYRDGEGRPYNLLLNREGAEWKIGSLAGIELVP